MDKKAAQLQEANTKKQETPSKIEEEQDSNHMEVDPDSLKRHELLSDQCDMTVDLDDVDIDAVMNDLNNYNTATRGLLNKPA